MTPEPDPPGERRPRLRERLADVAPSSLFELLVAGVIVLGGVVIVSVDLGVDLQRGFERLGRGAGETDGPQARPWGVAEAEARPVRDLPSTGVLARRRAPGEGAVRVTLRPRAGAPHAYVKLVGVEDGALELAAFVRAGEALEVALPPGAYDLRYALGESWYGRGELFGAATRYAAAPQALDTRLAGEPGWDGTVELPRVVGGEVVERVLSRPSF